MESQGKPSDESGKDLITRMEQAWQVTERPFVSKFPVLGPLIAWFRERWNRVSTRWYVLALLEQQNHFNRLLLELAYQVHAIQRNMLMIDHLIAQQADLIADRGLSIAALAEGMAHLNEQVIALQRWTGVRDDPSAPGQEGTPGGRA
jgi:hypothetical protein